MEDVNIVLITGMSGAGKSTAMSVLEDMGYHCIDQFPVELIQDLGKLFAIHSTTYVMMNFLHIGSTLF
jgi:RNase adaptor protein for sRNA GlmZ degradation